MRRTLLLLTLAAAPAWGEINECRDENGKTYYTDEPCPQGFNLESSRKTDAEKQAEQRERQAAERKLEEGKRKRQALYESIRKAETLKQWHEYEENDHRLINSPMDGHVYAVADVLQNQLLVHPDSLEFESCDPVMTDGETIKARCAFRAKSLAGQMFSKTQVFHFDHETGDFIKVTDSQGKHLAFE